MIVSAQCMESIDTSIWGCAATYSDNLVFSAQRQILSQHGQSMLLLVVP
jgi:hypothetical protein